jgi:hypothetical protein
MDEGQIPTPTKSEFATFQVLANQEFINLNKRQDDDDENVHVTVVEDKSPMPAWEEEKSQPPTPLPPQESIPAEIFVDGGVVEEEEALPEPHDQPPRHEFKPELPKYIPSPSTDSYDSEKEEPPRRPSKKRESTHAEIEAEKEGLLSEIFAMERQGDVKLVRPLSMNDSLEEIQFQYDRMQAEVNATQIVDFAKNAIKMGSGMVEMVLKKSGLKVVDGYHNNLCKDMNKFNRPLNRLYKKYWRRGGMSPEAELGMLVFGSLAWTVVQNKMGSLGQEKEEAPPPPVRATKPPPQMSSLNIPASWGADSDEDEAGKKREKELADREALAREKERQAAERERETKERERALLLREQRLAATEELETLGSLDDEVRKVSIAGTPTKRRSRGKRAEVELNLDD